MCFANWRWARTKGLWLMSEAIWTSGPVRGLGDCRRPWGLTLDIPAVLRRLSAPLGTAFSICSPGSSYINGFLEQGLCPVEPLYGNDKEGEIPSGVNLMAERKLQAWRGGA